MIHPTNPNIIYAGGVAGGVWKSTDGGASWTALGDLFANMPCAASRWTPVNTNIIYAGTGEGYFNIDAVRGAGIFKSTDAGATWTQLPSTVTSDFYFVNRLAISPNDHTRVYAATRTGLWASSDSGGSLVQALRRHRRERRDGPGGAHRPEPRRAADGLRHLHRGPGHRLHPAQRRRGRDLDPGLHHGGHGAHRTGAGPLQPEHPLRPGQLQRARRLQGRLLSVLRSGDGGVTWSTQVANTSPTKLNTTLLSNAVYMFSQTCYSKPDAFFNQGWYDNVIAVDPVNPDVVWAGGVDLFRSDDQGQNWGLAACWWADQGATYYVHADHHAIVFHPTTTAPRTPLCSWQRRRHLPHHQRPRRHQHGPLRHHRQLHLDQPEQRLLRDAVLLWRGIPGGNIFFAGAQDNGTTRGSISGGPNN